MEKNQRNKKQNFSSDTLKIYWRHSVVYWPTLILCVLGAILVICCDMLSPLVYKKFVDLLALDPFHQSTRGTLKQFYDLIFVIGLVSLGAWIGTRLSIHSICNIESRVMADLSNACFEYLHQHSSKFFTNNFSGSLVKRINRFAAGYEVIADQCFLQMGQTIIRIVLIIGILFWRNTVLGYVFLIWTIVFVAFHIIFSRYKFKADLYRAEMDTVVTARLSDTITNNSNLKLFAGLEREASDFKEIANTHRLARVHSWNLGEISYGIQGFSVKVLEIVVLVMAVQYWAKGILTLGDFILLRSYLNSLSDKVQEVGQSLRRIYESMADANEMTEILLMEHEIKDDEFASVLTVPNGIIEFHNVQFNYPGTAKTVLSDFNLRTKSGERIGIVGPSGGGKTTILKLIERLYDVTEGSVHIDGQNTTKVTQDSLRRSIAYVPQDPVLFHRSLMENIRYSKPGASDEDVIKASKLAHCHEFISSFSEGYNTLVGERGIKLSGGERQRVAIARAILMNAPILIMDEATSSLDSESEMFIDDALTKLMAGRTVIVVAHRLSTIRKMNRIVVLEKGLIVEQGDHDLLVRIEDGLYQKLWNLQSFDSAKSDSKERKDYIQ